MTTRPTIGRPTRLAQTLKTAEEGLRRAAGAPKRPPGPPRAMMTWETALFFRDPLSYLERVNRTWGDITYCRFGSLENFQVNHPELIEQVLVKKATSFSKDSVMRQLQGLLGQGLLTSENPLWKRQRKLAAPALKRRQIEAYADTMVARTKDWCARVEPGQVIDVHGDMMEITLKIVVETLFGVALEEDVHAIGHALDDALEHFLARVNTAWRLVPDAIPTPTQRRYSEALAHLDRVVYGVIDRRSAEDDDGDDLLIRLMRAEDEDGSKMSREQLRDEVLTMFLAGHETTALALTFAWRHLVEQPALIERLRAEAAEVLGGRDAVAADSKALPFTEAVVLESLRMTPPAWIVAREALEDVQIGDYVIPKGATVATSPWVVQRDPRNFERPLEFDPDRWLDGRAEAAHRFAFFPFGGGPRVCIGTHFAMMEAILILATMAQHHGLEFTHETPPLAYIPAITLRPDQPIRLRVT